MEGDEAGEARPEIAERLFGDGGDQPAGMFIALDINQFELMEQADLQLDHHDMGLERFEDGELGAGIAGVHQLFEQVIEIGDQAITEAEFMLTGQAMQQGNKPTDQIEAGFDDRQLTAGDGGAGIAAGGISGVGIN